MKLLALLLAALALIAIRELLRALSTPERRPLPQVADAEPSIFFDPHLESPFTTLWERAR